MTNKIIFFPFTHITQNQLNVILTFFQSFQYSPINVDFSQNKTLKQLSDQGKIIPWFSSSEDLLMVEQKLEQYLAWAQVHKGSRVDLKSLLKDTPYFTSDTSVNTIKSQIKPNIESDKSLLHDKTDQERDLLFLKMAQLCDEQNEGIDLELAKLDKTRDELVSTLRGIENFSNENLKINGGINKNDTEDIKMPVQKDMGAIMTRERINSWSGCMAQKRRLTQEGGNSLFITTSPAVFEYLESNCEDVVNTLDIDKIKVHENKCENKNEWRNQFLEFLVNAIQADDRPEENFPKVNDKCSFSGKIKLSLFSGNDINNLFNTSDKQIPVCLITLK
jgi:hypothetical protein